jgi:hypothetical protein
MRSLSIAISRSFSSSNFFSESFSCVTLFISFSKSFYPSTKAFLPGFTFISEAFLEFLIHVLIVEFDIPRFLDTKEILPNYIQSLRGITLY